MIVATAAGAAAISGIAGVMGQVGDDGQEACVATFPSARYEPDAELRDQMIQHTIDVTEGHIKACEAEHFQSEPCPSSGTSQH